MLFYLLVDFLSFLCLLEAECSPVIASTIFQKVALSLSSLLIFLSETIDFSFLLTTVQRWTAKETANNGFACFSGWSLKRFFDREILRNHDIWKQRNIVHQFNDIFHLDFFCRQLSCGDPNVYTLLKTLECQLEKYCFLSRVLVRTRKKTQSKAHNSISEKHFCSQLLF